MSDSTEQQLAALRRQVAELSDRRRQAAAPVRASGNVLVAAATLIVVSLFLPWMAPQDDLVTSSEEFGGAVIGWSLVFVEPWPMFGVSAEGILVGLAALLFGVALLAILVLAVASTASESQRLLTTTVKLSGILAAFMTVFLCVWAGMADEGGGPKVGYVAALLGVATITVAAKIRSG